MKQVKREKQLDSSAKTNCQVKLQLHGSGSIDAEADSFTCGTVLGYWQLWQHGIASWPHPLLCILDVKNTQLLNGHFRQLLDELISYCSEKNYDLGGLDVNNKELKEYLLTKREFQALPNSSHVVLACSSSRQ
jgi:hypothetical protein